MIKLHSISRQTMVMRQSSSNFSPMELALIPGIHWMEQLSTGHYNLITWALPGCSLKAVLTSTFHRSIFGSPLWQAASSGFQDIVQLLLQNNANVHAIDERKGTALQAAARSGYQETIQTLLDHDAVVNAHPAALGTALQIAASEGHLKTVKILLERDVNVNLVAGEFSTALRAESSMGPRKSLRLSRDKQGEINIPAFYERWVDHLEIIKCLVNEGVDINAHGEGDGYATALQEASILGHLDVVQTLLDNHANPNIYGGDIGKQIGTALQAACVAGHHEIVLLLLRFNADAYIQGGRLGSAIHIASTKGRDHIVQALLGSSRN
ncbi:uncharacterized protein N7529_003361 [Penicillium soppii]|uniref:uncharacterized protein n=1 Tax=Penicillium soppii TaxID=69789 RepID=UPI002548F50E|nr:uncharacterized protein N7529_003361 [Penicillium soppii]KAJ5874931.1 hypothetical protein N7529_003361 [Penicillium soppii]